MGQSATETSRSKVFELKPAYLKHLIVFARNELKNELIAKHIRESMEQSIELEWSTSRTRQELANLLDATGFLCIQVLYQASYEMTVDVSIKGTYQELVKLFLDWWIKKNATSALL